MGPRLNSLMSKAMMTCNRETLTHKGKTTQTAGLDSLLPLSVQRECAVRFGLGPPLSNQTKTDTCASCLTRWRHLHHPREQCGLRVVASCYSAPTVSLASFSREWRRAAVEHMWEFFREMEEDDEAPDAKEFGCPTAIVAVAGGLSAIHHQQIDGATKPPREGRTARMQEGRKRRIKNDEAAKNPHTLFAEGVKPHTSPPRVTVPGQEATWKGEGGSGCSDSSVHGCMGGAFLKLSRDTWRHMRRYASEVAE